MKANKRAARAHLERDDEAVTSILGAILVVVLLVGVLVTIRLQFVPVWEENAEAAHMLQIENELSTLRAQMDRQTGNTSTGNVANQITLGQSRVSMFAQRALPPFLSFAPTPAKALTLDAENMTVFLSNGTLIPLADNEWVEITATTFVDTVQKVLALRLNVSEISSSNIGDSVRIVIEQGNGNYGGEFRLDVEKSQPNNVIRLSTRNAAGDTIFSVAKNELLGGQTFSPYFVNVMDDDLLFDQVLEAAVKPLSLTLFNNGFGTASYSIVFFEGDGSGSVLVGGGGVSVKNFVRSFNGGTLTYAANNNFLVAQNFVIEHGALILQQENGAVFKVNPGFDVVQVGQTTGVSFTIPTMKGSEKSFSGNLVSIVNTQRSLGQSFSAVTDAFNVTLETGYPDLWADFFRDEFADAGLLEGDDFALDVTGDTVTLSVLGTAPVSTIKDIALSVVQANINIRLEA